MSFSLSRKVAWMIWVVASIFYAYQYILRVMPNILLHDIMFDFTIGAATFGQFSGIYYIGYSLMHLPLGILLDRYGPRKIMTACLFLTIIGSLPLLFSEHFFYPILGRLVIGVGSSGAILGVFKIIRMSFSEKYFPRMLSLSVTIGLLGAIYGGGPVSYMREALGYKQVIQIFIGLGIVLMGATYCILPDIKYSSQKTILSNIKDVIKNRQVLWTCLFAGLMVGPLEGFADVWASAFLKEVYNFETPLASSLPSMIFMGMCFGAPLLSFVAEKIRSQLVTIIISGAIMFTCFTFMLLFMIKPGLLSFCFVLIGVCCAYQVLAIYKASTYVREEVSGVATAVANMIIMLFGYLFHAIIGSIVTVIGGSHLPSALTYGLAIIPLALFLGATGFMFLHISEIQLTHKRSHSL